MRTTVDLPDDLHKQVHAIARDTGHTLSAIVVDLMRRGLGSAKVTPVSKSPRTGLPVVSIGAPVTSEDVRSLEDPQDCR